MRPSMDTFSAGYSFLNFSACHCARENSYSVQLELPLDRHNWELDAAVDAVRDRFGSRAITRGVLLGKDPGIEMPMLPD